MVICGLFDIFKNIKKVGDTANSIKKDGLAGFSKNSLKLALHNLAKMAGAAFKHAVFSVVSIILPYAVPIIAIVVSIVVVTSLFASLFNFWNSNNNEGTGTGTLTGATVQEKVWIALTEAGYSEYATAGVMGNMQAESDFDPAAGEAGYSIESGGIGLVQWTNDGRGGSGGNTNLRKYAESIGKSWTDEDVQIELKANSTLPCSLYIDNFKVEGDFGDAVSTVKPLNGKFIKNLIVNDKENSADWSIIEKLENGALLFGDRDVTAIDIPANLIGAEFVKTACDSKMFVFAVAFSAAFSFSRRASLRSASSIACYNTF